MQEDKKESALQQQSYFYIFKNQEKVGLLERKQDGEMIGLIS